MICCLGHDRMNRLAISLGSSWVRLMFFPLVECLPGKPDMPDLVSLMTFPHYLIGL
jgi:hypothetical protein